MAMIDKIRKRKGILMVFIGIGMLGFIVPFDAVMALFGQGSNQAIGEINGKSISIQRYSQEREIRKNLFNYSSPQNLDQDLWNQMVDEAILSDEYDAIGMSVTDEEFDEIMFGEILSPYVQSTFYGQGPITLEQKEQQRLKFENMEIERRDLYNGYKDIITERRLKEKWIDLISKGIYANTLDAKYDYKIKNDSRSFDYVMKSYKEIPDSLIAYDEGDIKGYYRDHKGDKEYKQNTERDIEYIEFKVEASEGDILSIENELLGLKSEWEKATGDSLFCIANSTSGGYITFDYKDGDFDGDANENLMNDPIGSLVGPYEHNNYLRLVKIQNREMNKMDSVKVRHILINGTTDEELKRAQEVVDSLKAELRSGADFAELVTRHSEDKASIPNGGEYSFTRGRMDKEFEKASFNGNVGDITQATSVYGIHLIEILNQTYADIVTCATIDRPLKPSSSTVNASYSMASEFGINNNDLESFRDAADTSGYTILKASKIARNAQTVSNLRNPFELVSWAYNSDVGEVSPAFLVDNKWIVAVLTGSREAGEPLLEDVHDNMEKEVIKEKKGTMYAEIMGDPSLGSPQTIAGAAETRVRKATKVKFSSLNIPGAGGGRDVTVIGVAYGIPVGEMSTPIIGDQGVYIIAPTEDITEAEEKDNYLEEQGTVMSTFQDRSKSQTTGFFGVMKVVADIEDNRQ